MVMPVVPWLATLKIFYHFIRHIILFPTNTPNTHNERASPSILSPLAAVRIGPPNCELRAPKSEPLRAAAPVLCARKTPRKTASAGAKAAA